MIYWFAILATAVLVSLACLLLSGLAAVSASLWIVLLTTAVAIAVTVRVATVVLRPGVLAAAVLMASAMSLVVCTIGTAAIMLLLGNLQRAGIEANLKDLIDRRRAIEIMDASGRPIGILPAVLIPGRADEPYLALTARPESVPTVFWKCAAYLEDRQLDEDRWFHVQGLDFHRLIRAVLSKFYLKAGGASTLAEMLDRSLRNALPKRPGLISSIGDLTRKMQSWRDLPALTSGLFPEKKNFRAAVATHLPLMRGARGSSFGGEIRGVGLAALMLGRRNADELTDGESALLAGAINLPLHIGGEDVQTSWSRARARAGLCLARADLGEGFDRERARRQVAALLPPDPAQLHPAREAMESLAGRAPALVHELAKRFGAKWYDTVARVRLATSSRDHGLLSAMEKSAREVERNEEGRLAVPIWSSDTTFVYGAVADSNGDIVATVSNSDYDLASAPVPIGSVAKIVAAVALSANDVASSAVQTLFARSDSVGIERRLRRVSDTKITETFRAFDWPVPPDQSARRLAAYGAVEIAPDRILRGAIALTDLLFADRTSPVALTGLIRDVETVDGSHVSLASPGLPMASLRAMVTPGRRPYVARVLGAPLRDGTMRAVGAALRKEGVTLAWGKSGTADASPGGKGIASTRAIWNVGGFAIGKRRLSYVMVVTSRTGDRPLGFVESPALAPMTTTLLKDAATRLKKDGSTRCNQSVKPALPRPA